MDSHNPFEYLKYKLWSKERSKVKLPIWLFFKSCLEEPNSKKYSLLDYMLEVDKNRIDTHI
jgi:protease II